MMMSTLRAPLRAASRPLLMSVTRQSSFRAFRPVITRQWCAECVLKPCLAHEFVIHDLIQVSGRPSRLLHRGPGRGRAGGEGRIGAFRVRNVRRRSRALVTLPDHCVCCCGVPSQFFPDEADALRRHHSAQLLRGVRRDGQRPSLLLTKPKAEGLTSFAALLDRRTAYQGIVRSSRMPQQVSHTGVMLSV